MKKAFLIILILLTTFTSPVFALDYILGAKGGYFGWDPFFQDIYQPAFFTDVKTGTGVLYGPIFSIIFTQNLSFSISGLMGNQSTHWDSDNQLITEKSGQKYHSGSFHVEEKRYDFDSALNIRLSDNFRIFAGFKYQFLQMTIYGMQRYVNLSNNPSINVMTIDMDMPLYGPALGFGYSLTFADRYFFAINISGIYMIGKIKQNFSETFYDNSIPNGYMYGKINSDSATMDMKEYGFNIEPSVGINTGGGGPIITLGLRYQYVMAKITNYPAGRVPESRDWLRDYLYGIFVGVMYAL
jgi:hypothetical protein